MKSSFKIFLLLISLFYASQAYAQSKDSIIRNIRASYLKINGDSSPKKIELDNEAFLPQAVDEGISLTGYLKGNTVYKMKVWIGLSYGIHEYEYYFKQNKLFFIYETEKDFPEDGQNGLNHNKLVLAFEGRYYIDAGKVIDIKVKGQKRFNPKTSVNDVTGLMKDAKSYVRKLRSRLQKNPKR